MILFLVVAQNYEVDVIKEFAIRGNSAVMKCQVPSYVSDFVHVVSWITEDSEYVLGSDYGSEISLFKNRMRSSFNPRKFLSKTFLKFYKGTVGLCLRLKIYTLYDDAPDARITNCSDIITLYYICQVSRLINMNHHFLNLSCFLNTCNLFVFVFH